MGGMKRYPRSFLQLVTLGYVVVALPLLAVLGYAVLTLDKLSDHYQMVIENVSDSGRLVGELAEDLQHMERNLRRHEILNTGESFRDYEEVREEWREHMYAFLRLAMLPPPIIDDLHGQLAIEGLAFKQFAGERDPRRLRGSLDELRGRYEGLADAVRKLIERDQADIQQTSGKLVRHVMLALAVAVVAAICSIWGIRRLISRLLGRFERAVLALGRGDLATPILFDGPGDLRWLGRWFEWLRKRLLSLEEDRTQVLRHVSHELKTPLAALQEGSSLLAEGIPGPLTAAQQKILGIVQNNAKRLQELIEGLLHLQQAGHAAERNGYEELDYTALIQQVIETHRLLAEERRVVFDLELPQALPIIAGREALVTIVHNLVSNAVKFAPPGSRVSVTLSATPDTAILAVCDQGPGIAEAELTVVFEPFFRSAATRQIPGIGLGLAIAREFVMAHRGEIVAANAAEGGACFTVTLPLAAPFLRKPENG